MGPGGLPGRALLLVLLFLPACCGAGGRRYVFNIQEAPYTRLCETKNILTVNGEYPGPTIRASKGETVVVLVCNRANDNITLHWHGVKQPGNPWSDGPAYITQCPIQPGANFTYSIILSDEEGTIWWHAHSDWARATVHGAIIVYPLRPQGREAYPFPNPDGEIPLILGEWWTRDVREVLEEMLRTGGAPNVSDAFTINGQPGHLYPCSNKGMYKVTVRSGRRYLLRVVNAAMNDELFFAVARHRLTVVGADGSYTKPFATDYIVITPGQTMDLLVEANQAPNARYFMAARAYSSNTVVVFDNTTATAVLQYDSAEEAPPGATAGTFPFLPAFNDTDAVAVFTRGLKSLASKEHPVDVPRAVEHRLLITTSVNELPCGGSCAGPNGTRLVASLNNISFVEPPVDVLGAYYRSIGGVYRRDFPDRPPLFFNFTAEELPPGLMQPTRDTRVKVLSYNTSVEIVFQGTNLVAALTHPMHLHGYSFFVVGQGPGNFDGRADPPGYNLVDPPRLNTFSVPRSGWAAVRFRTSNPGVWFMHCHFERHTSWGMETVLVVENGGGAGAQMLPPPPAGMPPC